MEFDFHGLLYTLSYALDCVEGELVGVSTGHSKRVAYIAASMGKKLGMGQEELEDLTACAVLHDNALTQYIAEEYGKEESMQGGIGVHCVMGEENVKNFPFHHDMKGVILYHHETVDGTGPFGVPAVDTPLGAQLIHFADALDAKLNLSDMKGDKYQEVLHYLKEHTGKLFFENQVQIFFQHFTEGEIKAIFESGMDGDDLLPGGIVDYSQEQVKNIIDIFAEIIDYKSVFTRKHSIGIAEKAYKMGQYYGYSDDICFRLYVAGALHDVGKMAISNRVLEKPERLTDAEFGYMKDHAWHTYKILSKMKGFEDITSWASHHHEKLNGKGYPFGKRGEELGRNERLMACLDIYQALREERPYKSGMPHEKTLGIMRKMVGDGYIDAEITEDIDRIFSETESRT